MNLIDSGNSLILIWVRCFLFLSAFTGYLVKIACKDEKGSVFDVRKIPPLTQMRNCLAVLKQIGSPGRSVADDADSASPAHTVTGTDILAIKPVVEKHHCGRKASSELCHYPTPCRMMRDHHSHTKNCRLLFLPIVSLEWKISFRQLGFDPPPSFTSYNVGNGEVFGGSGRGWCRREGNQPAQRPLTVSSWEVRNRANKFAAWGAIYQYLCPVQLDAKMMAFITGIIFFSFTQPHQLVLHVIICRNICCWETVL